MNMKVSTLRLPEPMAKQLGAIARAEGIPVSEVLREGIENHIASGSLTRTSKSACGRCSRKIRDVLRRPRIEG